MQAEINEFTKKINSTKKEFLKTRRRNYREILDDQRNVKPNGEKRTLKENEAENKQIQLQIKKKIWKANKIEAVERCAEIVKL